MTFKTDREIIQELLPVRLFGAVVLHGIDDPNGEVAKQLMLWLTEAEDDIIKSATPGKRDALRRRAWRLHDVILKPFKESETHVAKFALIVFHMLAHIRDCGMLHFEEGGPLDQAISAVLSDEGTVVEFANKPKVDESAHKQARKMFAIVQAEGYYRGVVWA
jgi:hypothetical protein